MENNEVGFTLVKDGSKSGNPNQKNDQYNFCFNGVMDMLSQQETIFETVAKDVSICTFKNNLDRLLNPVSMAITELSSPMDRLDQERPIRLQVVQSDMLTEVLFHELSRISSLKWLNVTHLHIRYHFV
jgi:hypothetical protein